MKALYNIRVSETSRNTAAKSEGKPRIGGASDLWVRLIIGREVLREVGKKHC